MYQLRKTLRVIVAFSVVATEIAISLPRYRIVIYWDVLLFLRVKLNQAARPRDSVNEDEDTAGGKRGNLTRNVGRSLADWLALPLRLLCDSEWGMLRWVVVCRGWWRWVDSLVGWSGWLCVLGSCCARETRGFRASTSGTARQNSDQFHVARTTLSLTTFLWSFTASVAENLSSWRRYLSAETEFLCFIFCLQCM